MMKNLRWWHWVLVAIGLFQLLMLAAGTLFLLEVLPSSRTTPGFAGVSRLEAAYPELLERLGQAAQQGGITASQLAPDQALVAPVEILEAKVGQANSYLLIGGKRWDQARRRFILPRKPALGRPVVNQYWDTLADGSQRTILCYEAVIPRADGSEGVLIIVFDLEALRARLERE